jgi:hypothetical protein
MPNVNCSRNGSAVAHDLFRPEAIRRVVEIGLKAKGNDRCSPLPR